MKDCGASEFVYTVLDIFKNTIQAKIVVCNYDNGAMSGLVQEQDRHSSSWDHPHWLQSSHVSSSDIVWWYSDSDDKNGDGYYMNKLGQYYRPSELDPEVCLMPIAS